MRARSRLLRLFVLTLHRDKACCHTCSTHKLRTSVIVSLVLLTYAGERQNLSQLTPGGELSRTYIPIVRVRAYIRVCVRAINIAHLLSLLSFRPGALTQREEREILEMA